MGEIVPGPGFGRPPVDQAPQRLPYGAEWCLRGDDGFLWVWIGTRRDGRWVAAPVEESREPIWRHGKAGTLLRGTPVSRKRITMVLDACGMEGPEVDEALGVSTPDDATVDGWEDGSVIPTESDIRRLATLTGNHPRWFYGEDPPEPKNSFSCKIDDGYSEIPEYTAPVRPQRPRPFSGVPPTDRRTHLGVAQGDLTVAACGQQPSPGKVLRLTGNEDDVDCYRCNRKSVDP